MQVVFSAFNLQQFSTCEEPGAPPRPGACIASFDAAGNMLGLARNEFISDYILTDPIRLKDGWSVRRYYQFQAYSHRGFPLTAWAAANDDDVMEVTRLPPLNFYAKATAVDSRGRIFAANGRSELEFYQSKERCVTGCNCLDWNGTVFVPDGSPERVTVGNLSNLPVNVYYGQSVSNPCSGVWTRVFRRDGDYISDFPVLHGACVNAIAIDDNDRVFVGGYPYYQDNAYLRRYDADGQLDWSLIAPDPTYNTMTGDALFEVVDAVLPDGSGGCYFSGETQSGIFFAHADSSGTLTWKWTALDDRGTSFGQHFREGRRGFAVTSDVPGVIYTAMAHMFPVGHPYECSMVQKRDAATGAVIAHGLFEQGIAPGNIVGDIQIADGILHAVFDRPTTMPGPVYYRLSLSDLSLIDSAEWVGDNGATFSIHDGVAYFGKNIIPYRLSDGVNPWAGKTLFPDKRSGDFYGRVSIRGNTPIPPKAFSIKPAIFSWIGDTYTHAAALTLPVRLASPVFRREYVGTLRLPDIYRLLIEPDLWLVISSVSIRRNTDGAALTVISPEGAAPMIAALRARQASGAIAVLYRGVRFADGDEQLEPMLRGPIQTLRSDRGGRSGSLTITVDAGAPDVVDPQIRLARGLSYVYRSGQTRRVRCAVDTFLRPGDTLMLPDGDAFIVASLTYTISPIQAEMEATE